MPLEVDTPDPPDLTNRGLPAEFEPPNTDVLVDSTDLRREELELLLRDGAWEEAFNEWSEYTELTVDEYTALRDVGVFERFDIYWDPVDERLRFELLDLAGTLPDQSDIPSRAIDELTDLGQTLLDMLEDAYIDWGTEGETEDVWSGQTFDEESPPED